MELVCCCIRDAKSELYGNPMFMVTVGTAIRQFTDEVNHKDENNVLYRHPEDYSLWQLGTWDNVSGIFTSLVTHKMLVQGNEVKEVKDNHLSLV